MCANARQAELGNAALPVDVVLDSVRYAGIISVGCHGTSKDFGSIADLVESLTAVDGSGRPVVYDATHPLFSQARTLHQGLAHAHILGKAADDVSDLLKCEVQRTHLLDLLASAQLPCLRMRGSCHAQARTAFGLMGIITELTMRLASTEQEPDKPFGAPHGYIGKPLVPGLLQSHVWLKDLHTTGSLGAISPFVACMHPPFL